MTNGINDGLEPGTDAESQAPAEGVGDEPILGGGGQEGAELPANPDWGSAEESDDEFTPVSVSNMKAYEASMRRRLAAVASSVLPVGVKLTFNTAVDPHLLFGGVWEYDETHHNFRGDHIYTKIAEKMEDLEDPEMPEESEEPEELEGIDEDS